MNDRKRDIQFELYKKFISDCTTATNSLKNYIDFKRINECLQLLFPQKENVSILDFDDADSFDEVIDKIGELTYFSQIQKKGNGQYLATMRWYQRFLNAKKIFSSKVELLQPINNYIGLPLQQIYYGAPGTGKSHEIKEMTEGKRVVRTTFHPDSDYSTFVGAYKPTTVEVPMRDVTGKVIMENGKPVTENRIVYEFVEQAFLQAYIKAWELYVSAMEDGKEAEEVFLVIEEINRGNCAQIFGDLFQLLDRGDNGFSEYPIVADKDLQKLLKRTFENINIKGVPAVCGMSAEEVAQKIENGEILLLPNNLYIWATMNTSDQSLFPIDSAFKRRWDWHYMPISDGEKGWKIEANGKRYDWWEFLRKVNEQIGTTTNSEDKKLGYYFCKAKNGVVDAETFVGKVIFYLWNDVFKDFAEEVGGLFNDEDGSPLSFNKFYIVGADGHSEVVEEKVEQFMRNLGVDALSENDINEDDIEDSIIGESKKTLSAVIYKGEKFSEHEMTQFDIYITVLKRIGIDKVGPIIETMKYERKGSKMATKVKVDSLLQSNYTYVQVDDYYFVKGANSPTLIKILEGLKNELHLDMILEVR